ncbi:MAG: HAD family hydrolase [Deltaproteobacteria bacterium]|nr:HAD family hydrolase [Candidatus Zymogenaceae bacterium]
MTRPPLEGVTALVFDFDGTLAELNIDFPALYVRIFELADRFGVDRSRVSEGYLIELIDEMTAQLPDGRAADFYSAATRLVVDEEVASAGRASLFNGTRALLAGLRKRKIAVGLVTRNCEAAVKTVFPDVEDLVDAFVPRERTLRVKPDPLHLAGTLSLLTVSPARAAMVGDHPIDIVSAIKAGMIPVGVTTGKISREELISAGAVLVLARASELEDYL